MKFREHRGSLEDSMKTMVELEPTLAALLEHLNKLEYPADLKLTPTLRRADIAIGADTGQDPRIAWPACHLVSVVGVGVVGMLSQHPSDSVSIADMNAVQLASSEQSYKPVVLVPDKVVSNELPKTSLLGQLNGGALLNAGAMFDIPAGKFRESAPPFGGILDSVTHVAAMDPGATPDQILIAEVDQQGNLQHIRDVLSHTNWEANPGRTGEDWLKGLRELIANGDRDAALHYIDSIPDELEDMKIVQKGFVTIPDAENMTEAMVDASRGMHLYYIDNGSGVSHQRMREHLARYAPWSEKHYPEWFRQEDGHLTKAGRAILAHALTIGAYRDPEAKRHYFDMADAKPRVRLWDNPIHQRIRLTFKPMVMGEVFDGGGFVIHQRFLAARPVAHEELNAQGISRFELILNRSDIPKQHRGMFKSNALKMTLDLVNEGKEVQFGPVELFTKVESSSFEVTPTMASRY